MRISTVNGLLVLLDEIVARSGRGDVTSTAADNWWREMLTRPGHPLNTNLPDEPLVDWHERGLLPGLDGARVLDVGCGNGRNSAWLAQQGSQVLGIDISASLLDHVRPSMPTGVTLRRLDVLRDQLPTTSFDLVYDSGCFHHVSPHRRITYLQRVLPLLAPGGAFGIVTLSTEVTPGPDDLDIVLTGDTAGGMPFTRTELVEIFGGALRAIETRAVQSEREGTFGADFLNCALFQRTSANH